MSARCKPEVGLPQLNLQLIQLDALLVTRSVPSMLTVIANAVIGNPVEQTRKKLWQRANTVAWYLSLGLVAWFLLGSLCGWLLD